MVIIRDILMFIGLVAVIYAAVKITLNVSKKGRK